MEVRRISPEDGILRELLNQRKRLKSVETRPSGNIVIRETLSASDPTKGRDILFGLLPDGSYGIDPWFGDTIPPNVPSEPKASGVVGGILVEWDGLDEYGMGQPDDYNYTLVEVSSDGRQTWEFGTKITNTAPSATISLIPGEYYVRLQSYDMKGNASDFSVYTNATALSMLDSEAIQEAIDQQQLMMDELEGHLNDNEAAQRQLQDDMTALRDRVSPLASAMDTLQQSTIPTLQTSVNGKNSIFRETTAPASNNTRGVVGDRWEQWSSLAVSGKLLKTFRKTATGWVEDAIDPVYIPKIDISQGTFGELSGGRITVGSILADRVLVGVGPNIIPNGSGEWEKSGGWSSGLTFNTGHRPTGLPGSFTSNGSTYTPPSDYIPVEPNTEYYFEIWLKASVENSVIYVELRNQDGVHAASCSPIAGEPSAAASQYPVSNYTVPTSWTKLTAVVKTSATTQSIRIGQIFFNHTNGAVRNATQYIAGMKLIRRNTGNLIVNGSIKAAQIDSESVAADIGRFLRISTDQLVAGTVQMGTGVANKLFADIITGRKFYASQLVIGEPGNLFQDPEFKDPDGWGDYSIYINPTSGRNSTPGITIPGHASAQTGVYYGSASRDRQFSVTGGARYRVSVWVKPETAVAAGVYRLYMKYTNPTTATSGLFPTPSFITHSGPIAAGQWYEITGEIPLPEDAQKAFIGFYTASVAHPAAVFSTASVKEMITPNVIVDGSITSRKLETDLILATKIIAGVDGGTRAEMSPNGFRVFAKEPGSSNEATEVIRMGVAETDDYFAVTRSDGTPVATISQNGDISGQNIYANEGLYYKGYDLLDILGDIPRGVVARGIYDFGGNGAAGNRLVGADSWYGVITTSFIPEANRTYQIVLRRPMLAFASGGESQWAFRYRWVSQTDTSAPTQANTILWDQYITASPGPGSWHNDNLVTNLDTGTENIGKRLQILITTWCGPSTNTSYFRMFSWAGLTITDMGSTSPEPVYHTSAGGSQWSKPADPPPPVRQKYTKQYRCTNSMNYQGNNSQYAWNTGKMIQGPSPAGVGNTKSIGIFPNWQGDISGSTINNIRVIFNFEHWYYNGGGTARIGVHGHTGIPGAFSHAGVVATSANWPKPGSRWVTLPKSTYTGFANGSYRGVSLEGDGTYATYGYSVRPTIEITYTK